MKNGMLRITLKGMIVFILFMLATLLQAQDQADKSGNETSLYTIIIYTPQMKKLAKFYEEGLGLSSPSITLDNHIGYWLGSNYVGFEPVDKIVKNPGGITAWFKVENINLIFERLIDLGAKPQMEPTPQPYGDIHATALDPDGNLLGLIKSTAQ
ncbi:MAG: VOC family protein [Saprospiraceae bacterium]|nr:VOC family protein [Saprospiraceae bacterium]